LHWPRLVDGDGCLVTDLERFIGQLRSASSGASDRIQLLKRLLKLIAPKSILEIGVWEGFLVQRVFADIPGLRSYVGIDPWRQLENWEKPLNYDSARIARAKKKATLALETMPCSAEYLIGTTLEVRGKLETGSFDAVYIDGDHTLRGVTIDLISSLPLVREGGLILGDDAEPNIWQHGTRFAPTLVFPMVLHFAEAHQLPMVLLPHGQFVIWNRPDLGFYCANLSGANFSVDNGLFQAPQGATWRNSFQRIFARFRRRKDSGEIG